MEERKWADLEMDCLVNVFGRVGMESMLLDVPFVCKSWYRATQNPQCWEQLRFPRMDFDFWGYEPYTSRLMDEYKIVGYSSVTAFIKSVVNRSRHCAKLVELPRCTTEQALVYVAEECPALKVLLLPYGLQLGIVAKIPGLVSKWRYLEFLRLGRSDHIAEMLAQISIHCRNFLGLCLERAYIGQDEALSIVASLPNIKYLYLRYAYLQRESLVTILQGCKELEKLDVRDCKGFEVDDEILKLASSICKFMCENSNERDLWNYEIVRNGTMGFQVFDTELCESSWG